MPEALEAYAAGFARGRAARARSPTAARGDGPRSSRRSRSIGRDDGPFAVDVLTLPDSNPWLCQMRPSGFDFLPDGQRAAVCTWDGDVWMVDGLDEPSRGLTWRRIAAGLFQPLGLKVIDGQIYVGCRDQVVRLRDLNGDGEADFYECYNSDHQVTEHFHEFAMGLQVDAEGNFYYAKAARHGLKAVVPQHGTLLQDRQGRRADRDPGDRLPRPQRRLPQPRRHLLPHRPGRVLDPQEPDQLGQAGRVLRQHVGLSRRHGHRPTTAMEPPVCWITNAFDRSPAELVRVESGASGLGAAAGVAAEPLVRQRQGLRGAARGRRRPDAGRDVRPADPAVADRHHAGPVPARPTASSTPAACTPGPATGPSPAGSTASAPPASRCSCRSACTPGRTAWRSRSPDRLDRKAAADPTNYGARTWSLKRTVNYGSDHIDERPARIAAAKVSDDGRTVFLEIPEIRPTWCMEITYAIRGESGEAVEGAIDNTIHQLGD